MVSSPAGVAMRISRLPRTGAPPPRRVDRPRIRLGRFGLLTEQAQQPGQRAQHADVAGVEGHDTMAVVGHAFQKLPSVGAEVGEDPLAERRPVLPVAVGHRAQVVQHRDAATGFLKQAKVGGDADVGLDGPEQGMIVGGVVVAGRQQVAGVERVRSIVGLGKGGQDPGTQPGGLKQSCRAGPLRLVPVERCSRAEPWPAGEEDRTDRADPGVAHIDGQQRAKVVSAAQAAVTRDKRGQVAAELLVPGVNAASHVRRHRSATSSNSS